MKAHSRGYLEKKDKHVFMLYYFLIYLLLINNIEI